MHFTSGIPGSNQLLSRLPEPDRARLISLMSQTQLPKGRFLHRQGEPIETIYFPWGGVCSLTQTMDDGRMAELATVGTEGVVGYLAGFGETVASHDAMVQIPNGGAHTLPVHHFRAEMAQRGLLHDLAATCWQRTAFLRRPSHAMGSTTLCSALRAGCLRRMTESGGMSSSFHTNFSPSCLPSTGRPRPLRLEPCRRQG